jgi:hypothetical protein
MKTLAAVAMIAFGLNVSAFFAAELIPQLVGSYIDVSRTNFCAQR